MILGNSEDYFYKALLEFKELNPLLNKTLSRVDSIRPRLSVETIGKHTYLNGHSSLARYTFRSEEYVKEFLIYTTSCVLEETLANRLKLKGNVSVKKIKNFENRYYNELILCNKCKSPETKLVDKDKTCGNCGFKEQDPFTKKKSS